MSNDRTIPVETRRQLWFEAAGRCAICNKNVAEDPLTHFTANEADIAHIHDVNSKTHRFVPSYPAEKLNSAENLLLVCKSCHRVIDNELQATYTVRHLEAFKKRQKQRIELVTSITEDRRSIILIYTAKIGNYIPKITWSEAASAMIPNYFPSSSIPIEISDTTVYLADGDSDFWKAEECKINYVIDHMLKPLSLIHISEPTRPY